MIIAILSHTLELIPLQVSHHESSKRANNFLLMAYQLPREIQHIIWTHEFYLVFYISSQKDLYSTKMTKLFYIFPQQDQETIIRPEIFHNHTPARMAQKVICSPMPMSTRD